MVLQTYGLTFSDSGDNVSPFAGDYAPNVSANFYADLDTNLIYTQGNEKLVFKRFYFVDIVIHST